MSESRLFKKLKTATPGFHWQRHEDKLTSGIPDCDYGFDGHSGWVELKTYDSWPRNPKEPLKFSDLKPEQVNWAVARGRQTNKVWFLTQIDNEQEWFLTSWVYARKLGKMNRAQLIAHSSSHGKGSISKSISKVFTHT